jgi:D-glycero-D-manno-heptose 1,7-bisphosphate phosphatase
MEFDIDPYVAMVAAQRGIPYREAKEADDKMARNEAKRWFWQRTLLGHPTVVQGLKPTPILYLDIDGTVRREVPGRSVTTAADVTVYPAAVAKMKAAKEAGWRIVGITNQKRLAIGELTMDHLYENMVETARQCEGLFDKIMICPHHPQAPMAEMANCWCRKPRIGNVVQAALYLAEMYPEYYPPHTSLLVGNQDSDLLCAEWAGIPFKWAHEWRGEDPPTGWTPHRPST